MIQSGRPRTRTTDNKKRNGKTSKKQLRNGEDLPSFGDGDQGGEGVVGPVQHAGADGEHDSAAAEREDK